MYYRLVMSKKFGWVDYANLGAQIEELGAIADETVKNRDRIRMKIPNILHESVPKGDDEEGNTSHSMHGKMPEFKFQPRVHNDLIEENKWVDLGRAANCLKTKPLCISNFLIADRDNCLVSS